jgi:glutamate synthase domain-containing protein 3
VVVVLGKCGRNFGAGMNGGIAYVLDERGDFAERRCNTAGVDLDPLADDDIALLHRLISKHVEVTQSPRAKWILESWEQMLPKFIKVFPHEYKRVLARKPVPAVPARPQEEVLHG